VKVLQGGWVCHPAHGIEDRLVVEGIDSLVKNTTQP